MCSVNYVIGFRLLWVHQGVGSDQTDVVDWKLTQHIGYFLAEGKRNRLRLESKMFDSSAMLLHLYSNRARRPRSTSPLDYIGMSMGGPFGAF